MTATVRNEKDTGRLDYDLYDAVENRVTPRLTK